MKKEKVLVKYTDIDSYEDACKVNGKDPKKVPDFSMLEKKLAAYLLNHLQLIEIISAMNKLFDPTWKVNFHTQNKKHYPWLWVKADKKRPTGFGFSGSGSDSVDTNATVGSRLYYADEAVMKCAIKKFEKMYIINQLM